VVDSAKLAEGLVAGPAGEVDWGFGGRLANRRSFSAGISSSAALLNRLTDNTDESLAEDDRLETGRMGNTDVACSAEVGRMVENEEDEEEEENDGAIGGALG
jgi:hypothetical protein